MAAVAAQAANRSSLRRAGARRRRALGTTRPSAVVEIPAVRRGGSCTAVTPATVRTPRTCSGPVRDDRRVDDDGAGPGQGAGVLVLAATPSGRVADAPPRLSDELGTADVVAAE